MNISANISPLKVTLPAPSEQQVTGGNVASVNSISSVRPSITPQVNISGRSADTTIVENPTYQRPGNQVREDTPSASANAMGKIQPEDSADVQQQEGGEEQTENKATQEKANNPGMQEQYSELELKQISSLKMRNSEVLAHERAHSAVGGQYAGSPSYSYQSGPDGVKYAVAGEVSIDTSKVPDNPQATLQKAQQIKAAALAPAEPSGQDRRVAAKADQMAAQARNDILQQGQENSGRKSTAAGGSYEPSVPDYFTAVQSLQKENNLQQTLNNRIQQINRLYQSASESKASSTLHIKI